MSRREGGGKMKWEDEVIFNRIYSIYSMFCFLYSMFYAFDICVM